MQLDIQLVTTRIPDAPGRGQLVPATAGAESRGQPVPAPAANAGAWVEFRGVVRGEENGQPITALEYEAYAEMAQSEMRRLLEELAREHQCLAVKVVHRVGIIPVGEVAIYVAVAGKHRGETFALLTKFMDRLKQDVPIWKRRAHFQSCSSGRESAPSSRDKEQTRLASAATGQGTGGALAATLEDVLALVRANCSPLEPERVALNETPGRILREPVCAPEDQPPFDRSAMDGYALRLDDPASEFNIIDEIRAGDWKPRQLLPGQAVRIATGAALPGEGLQVVMKEVVQVEGRTLRVLSRDRVRNIRFRGEDARAGQVLVEAGTVLQPGSLALLASLGQVEPLVTRLPRVLHLATGNEIVPPEQTPQHGQIRDSNSTLVRAFLRQFAIEPAQVRVPEERAQAEAVVHSRLEAIDLLLVSGGASVGEHDFTRALFETLGFRVHLCRTNTRPGKPLIFATRQDGKLAFGLPGNPLAHFVCLNLFVRAALEKLAGVPERSLFSMAILAAELKADGNARETLWPAEVGWGRGHASATPLRWSSSGDLTSLARANALLRVPPGSQVLSAGTAVAFASTLFPA